MKLIATEEHYMSKAVNEQYMKVMTKLVSPAIRARLEGLQHFLESNREISDLGELRLAAMDKQGVDIQVISYGNNSPMDLPPESAVLLCRQANDELAGRFFDEPEYFPIFEKAAQLNVPVYFHPGFPDEKVSDYYYRGENISADVSAVFSAYGYGWHVDAGIHMIRMLLSGIFERLPDLKVITGHWGELVPYYFNRLDDYFFKSITGFDRKFSDIYKEHVYITPSGIMSRSTAMLAIEEMGADHVLWSCDFPYVRREDGKDFLMELDLSEDAREKIAYKNAETLLFKNAPGGN